MEDNCGMMMMNRVAVRLVCRRRARERERVEDSESACGCLFRTGSWNRFCVSELDNICVIINVNKTSVYLLHCDGSCSLALPVVLPRKSTTRKAWLDSSIAARRLDCDRQWGLAGLKRSSGMASACITSRLTPAGRMRLKSRRCRDWRSDPTIEWRQAW